MRKSVQKLKIVTVLTFGFMFGLLSTTVSSVAQAGLSPVKDYTYGIWNFDLVGKYYYTTSNFNSTGTNSYTVLPYNDYLQTVSGDLALRTVLPHTKWAFYLDAQMANTNARTYSSTNTTTNFTHIIGGTDYVLYQGFISLIPDFSVTVPLTPIDFTTQNAAISDGVTEATAKVIMEFYYSHFTLGGYGGYNYRSSGRSSQGIYGGYAQFGFKNWNFGGKLFGYSTIGNDQDTNNMGYRYVWALNADGGSLAYGSVNPNYIETDGWVEVHINPSFSISAGGGTAITGNNIANGWNIAGGISYGFGGANRTKKNEVLDFKEDLSDGVDQKLFQAPPPRAAPAPPPLAPAKAQPVQAPVIQAPRKPAPTAKSVQQQLNETEMQLELKKKPVKTEDDGQ